MKKLTLFLFISFYVVSFCDAQDRVQKLINDVKASNTIECYYLGQSGRPSFLFMKADTLNTLLRMDEKIQLFNDSSYTVKYYCFYGVLSKNDSIAFELLKKVINDSSEVYYHCGCMINTYAFNCLLVEKYSQFIQAKYTYGLPTRMGDSNQVYMFGKPDKKKYRAKLSQLKLLIDQTQYRDTLLRYIQE